MALAEKTLKWLNREFHSKYPLNTLKKRFQEFRKRDKKHNKHHPEFYLEKAAFIAARISVVAAKRNQLSDAKDFSERAITYYNRLDAYRGLSTREEVGKFDCYEGLANVLFLMRRDCLSYKEQLTFLNDAYDAGEEAYKRSQKKEEKERRVKLLVKILHAQGSTFARLERLKEAKEKYKASIELNRKNGWVDQRSFVFCLKDLAFICTDLAEKIEYARCALKHGKNFLSTTEVSLLEKILQESAFEFQDRNFKCRPEETKRLLDNTIEYFLSCQKPESRVQAVHLLRLVSLTAKYHGEHKIALAASESALALIKALPAEYSEKVRISNFYKAVIDLALILLKGDHLNLKERLDLARKAHETAKEFAQKCPENKVAEGLLKRTQSIFEATERRVFPSNLEQYNKWAKFGKEQQQVEPKPDEATLFLSRIFAEFNQREKSSTGNDSSTSFAPSPFANTV